MLLSFITPTKYIKEYQGQGDFVMALSHLINEGEINEYEKVITSLKLPVYLDNGCFETGIPEGIDFLIKKANRIKAEFVFAPDFLFDAKKTKRAVDNFIYIKKKYPLSFKTIAIPQAKNMSEYLRLYEEFNANPDIDAIGLSFLAISRSFMRKNVDFKEILSENHTRNRIEMLKELDKLNIKHKPAHLLGLGSSYKDVIFAKENCPWIISNDTSSCFWNAMQGKKVLDNGDIEGGKTKIKVDFEFNSAAQEQLDLAQYNINKVKNLCHK